MDEAKLQAFKFRIPTAVGASARGRQLPSDPNVFTDGCLAVVIAEDEWAARKRLVEWAAEGGYDSRWLEVADVTALPVRAGVVLGWVA